MTSTARSYMQLLHYVLCCKYKYIVLNHSEGWLDKSSDMIVYCLKFWGENTGSQRIYTTTDGPKTIGNVLAVASVAA